MNTHKRLFLGLLGASLLLVALLAAGTWYLIFNPARSIAYQVILFTMVSLLVGVVFLAFGGLAGIVITLLAARTFEPLQGPMRVAVNLFFPVALALGRLLRIDPNRIKRSFIEVNNQLVRARHLKVQPKELLLLVPHCLQYSECPHKITVYVDNCRRCGRCCISKLLDLKDKYGFNMGLATGGTLARKYVREYHPRAIVAVACERDLASGILDSNPIPVLGVTNERPCGPCFNTCVSIPMVERAIRYFCGLDKE
ncbi:DUF116 domain-containing protein [Desulfofundulus sp. TPOSR]|jgi:hypothetical protein|uniref:DUF116 domain-containing protein n=1 Tax=Desulfofundulus sp. TPOSR TaxID=2714340 RepID=UPI001409B47E|nr:DUF116 domain-containing protein [Desulfofundulus sp. TPOSR]NHM25635.1 DUF116 domain-containing protein [Desulfofundulus sp. TPOSR]